VVQQYVTADNLNQEDASGVQIMYSMADEQQQELSLTQQHIDQEQLAHHQQEVSGMGCFFTFLFYKDTGPSYSVEASFMLRSARAGFQLEISLHTLSYPPRECWISFIPYACSKPEGA